MTFRALLSPFLLLVCTSLLSFSSCQRHLVTAHAETAATLPDSIEGRYQLTVGALELAENNVLSTQVDEIVVLAYVLSAEAFDSPLLAATASFSESKPRRAWPLEPIKNDTSALVFFLIEMDTDKTIEQIEPVIRLNGHKLLVALNSRDKEAIRRYLGDDDLLGSITIDLNKQKEYVQEVSGVHLFDEYTYRLTLSD